MSIPLYFAMNYEESIIFSAPHTAQLGFGFREDGTVYMPNHIIPGSAIVINDAVLPKKSPQETDFRELSELVSCGCFLDFERSVCPVLVPFLKELQSCAKNAPIFAVPMQYSDLLDCCAVIVTNIGLPNSWTAFCKKQQERFGTWVWEVIPYKKLIKVQAPGKPSGSLSDALCRYRQTADGILYYDTMETITAKSEIAGYYGCIAGIGLYGELKQLSSEG